MDKTERRERVAVTVLGVFVFCTGGEQGIGSDEIGDDHGGV